LVMATLRNSFNRQACEGCRVRAVPSLCGGALGPGRYCDVCELEYLQCRERARFRLVARRGFGYPLCEFQPLVIDFLVGDTASVKRFLRLSMLRQVLHGKAYGRRTLFNPLLRAYVDDRTDVLDLILEYVIAVRRCFLPLTTAGAFCDCGAQMYST
jgi:hypothetical protein